MEDVEHRVAGDEDLVTHDYQRQNTDEESGRLDRVEPRDVGNEAAHPALKRDVRVEKTKAWHIAMNSWPPGYNFDEDSGSVHIPSEEWFASTWDDSLGQRQTIYIITPESMFAERGRLTGRGAVQSLQWSTYSVGEYATTAPSQLSMIGSSGDGDAGCIAAPDACDDVARCEAWKYNGRRVKWKVRDEAVSVILSRPSLAWQPLPSKPLPRPCTVCAHPVTSAPF